MSSLVDGGEIFFGYDRHFFMDVNFYVDRKENLILIGNPNSCGDVINYYDDTYAAFVRDKLKLWIIKVDDQIMKMIISASLNKASETKRNGLFEICTSIGYKRKINTERK
ncbi:MAG: hypothetical protein Q4C64_07310 [Erysipelotrichia bacterium]|nr:hypothetical protein [Erysipelotrichia bacterium]